MRGFVKKRKVSLSTPAMLRGRRKATTGAGLKAACVYFLLWAVLSFIFSINVSVESALNVEYF